LLGDGGPTANKGSGGAPGEEEDSSTPSAQELACIKAPVRASLRAGADDSDGAADAARPLCDALDEAGCAVRRAMSVE
jgi:hypothetical protein